jgi:hypothetical protein
VSVPEHLDAPLAAEMALGDHGRAHLVGPGPWRGGPIAVAVEPVGVRVYDVWAAGARGWAQLRRQSGRWVHDDLPGPVDRLRFWITPLDPADAPLVSLPAVEADTVRPYVPVAEGEPPLPGERAQLPSRLLRWVHSRSDDVVIAAMLDEWSEAAAEAAALGWTCGMPRGEDLPMAYARSTGAADRLGEHDPAFARWLAATLGQQVVQGLNDRRDAEARRAALDGLFDALGRVVRALDPGFRVDPAPPPVVGPRERHRWLVDEPLAARLDNPVSAAGAHQPVFVLRPLLLAGERVLLEGLVA